MSGLVVWGFLLFFLKIGVSNLIKFLWTSSLVRFVPASLPLRHCHTSQWWTTTSSACCCVVWQSSLPSSSPRWLVGIPFRNLSCNAFILFAFHLTPLMERFLPHIKPTKQISSGGFTRQQTPNRFAPLSTDRLSKSLITSHDRRHSSARTRTRSPD